MKFQNKTYLKFLIAFCLVFVASLIVIDSTASADNLLVDQNAKVYGTIKGNREEDYAPAGYVACGMRSDPVVNGMMRQLIYCPFTPAAQNAGIGLSGQIFTADTGQNGGLVSCTVSSNQVGMGTEYAKNSQMDYLFCQNLQGTILGAGAGEIMASSVSTDYMCPENAVIFAARNMAGKNDSWAGGYCVTLIDPIAPPPPPPPPCQINTFTCVPSGDPTKGLMSWDTNSCSNQSISGVGAVSSQGSTLVNLGSSATSYTLSADSENSLATCPAKPAPGSASLTVDKGNGPTHNLGTVLANTPITFIWSGSSGPYNSYYTATGACAAGTGTFPWIANNSGDTWSGPVPASQTGCSYAITYDANGVTDTVYLTVGNPPTPSGTIQANPSYCEVQPGNSTCATTINWTITNVSEGRIYRTINNASEVLFAAFASNGSQGTEQMIPGNSYTYWLYDYSSGSRSTPQLAFTNATAVAGTPPPVTQGVCNPAKTVPSATPPTSPQCSSGTFANDNFGYSNPGGGWSWNCLGTNPPANSAFCVAPIPVVDPEYNLTISKNIGGIVTSIDTKINESNCGKSTIECVQAYDENSDVTLNAIPSSVYWKFVGWGGEGCSGNGSCHIIMDDAKEVTATFVPSDLKYKEF